MERTGHIVLGLVLGLSLAGGVTGCRDRTVDVSLDKAIKFHDVKTGSGAAAREGSLVEVQYVGKLSDGKVVVDTHTRKPHRFVIGDGTVIPGLDVAVRGMRTGGVRVVTLPPHTHYGRKGYAGVIPEDAVMTFEVEMVRVERGGADALSWESPEEPGS